MYSPSSFDTLAPATGVENGISDIIRAAEAAVTPRTSKGFS